MDITMQGLVAELQAGRDIGHAGAGAAARAILSGASGTNETAALLGALAEKGETDDEILGMLGEMERFMVRVDAPQGQVIDMCGTGGDGLRTFNISTAASFVAAAAGAKVAKHGNRSSSGGFGSADVFEYFGCTLEQEPDDVLYDLERHGIGFMFAPVFHPAMRNAAEARRRLGRRTVFNILGPLSNPARVKRQLVGVSSGAYLSRIAKILARRGAESVMTVCSEDGMDEISTSSRARFCLHKGGEVTQGAINPKDYGMEESALSDLQVGGSAEDAAWAFANSVSGDAPRALVETVALNAAAGLVVAGVADRFSDAVPVALGTINSGRAIELLERFVAEEGDTYQLEGVLE